MINNVVLMGRLTRDPELKATGTGVEVSSFSIAVERNYKKGDERQTDFIDCVAWRKTAVFISQYFKKGSMIAVTGEIQTRSYEDKNGNKRKAVEVLVNNAGFCGSKADSGTDTGSYSAPVQAASVPQFQPTSDFEEINDDDDLPF